MKKPYNLEFLSVRRASIGLELLKKWAKSRVVIIVIIITLFQRIQVFAYIFMTYRPVKKYCMSG